MRIVKVSEEFRNYTDEEAEEYIRAMLQGDDRWTRRALLTLYDQQTRDEKSNPLTEHQSNGRGFSPKDQNFLSSIARAATRGATLTPKQMEWLHKLLPKYSKQLVKIMREKQMEQDLIEKDGISTFKFSQFEIDNNVRRMSALTGELGLDAEKMPRAIRCYNQSHPEDVTIFEMYKSYQSDPENPLEEEELLAFVYNGNIEDKQWILTVIVGEPEESENVPQGFIEFERMAKMLGKLK